MAQICTESVDMVTSTTLKACLRSFWSTTQFLGDISCPLQQFIKLCFCFWPDVSSLAPGRAEPAEASLGRGQQPPAAASNTQSWEAENQQIENTSVYANFYLCLNCTTFIHCFSLFKVCLDNSMIASLLPWYHFINIFLNTASFYHSLREWAMNDDLAQQISSGWVSWVLIHNEDLSDIP